MLLVLAACGLFAGSGLLSRRVGWQQSAFVVVVAAMLALAQYTLAQYL